MSAAAAAAQAARISLACDVPDFSIWYRSEVISAFGTEASALIAC
jgi:hypothetical protein